MKDNLSYPKEYKDKLHRIIYVQQNEFEKVIYTYYGDTHNIKVKYYYYRNSVFFDAFSRTGEVIFSTVGSGFNQFVEKKYDGTIGFVIHPIKKNIINKI